MQPIRLRRGRPKAYFGYIMKLNNTTVDAGAIQRPKVTSSKEAETRAVLAALKKIRKNDFERVCILTDAKEAVQALKGNGDWSINSIISDIKASSSFFPFVCML